METLQQNPTGETDMENSTCHCHECGCDKCHCHDAREEQDPRRISYYDPSPEDFDDWD